MDELVAIRRVLTVVAWREKVFLTESRRPLVEPLSLMTTAAVLILIRLVALIMFVIGTVIFDSLILFQRHDVGGEWCFGCSCYS